MHKAKAVVVLPENCNDIYEFFPALIYLDKLHEDLELSIIADNDFQSELSHLPFKTYHYPVEKSEFGPLASLKLAHKLKEIFNTTHCYNFRQGLGAINFVRSLKAKEMIGFSDPIGNLLYTRAVDEDKSKYPSMRYLDLVKDESQAPELRVKFVESEKLPENFFKSETHDPFIFLAVGDLCEDEFRFSLLEKCLEELKSQKVIMWSSHRNLHHVELFRSFPNIVDATEVHFSQIHHYILMSKGVLTDQIKVARLSTFIGVDHFLFDRIDHRDHSIPSFSFVLSQLNYDDHEIRYIEGGEQLKEMKEAHEVLDLIHEKFNL